MISTVLLSLRVFFFLVGGEIENISVLHVEESFPLMLQPPNVKARDGVERVKSANDLRRWGTKLLSF